MTRPLFCEFDFVRRKRLDVTFCAVFQKGAEGDEVIVLCIFLERRFIATGNFAIEVETIFADEFERNLAWVWPLCPLGESIEIECVVLGGLVASSTLDLEIFSKFSHQCL